VKKSLGFFLSVLVVAASGCGNSIRLGLPACDTPVNNPSAATVLVAQAVPTAHYAPCINSVKLGWDEVELSAASGRAALEIGREFTEFLTVSLTETCDISGATPVAGGPEDITRYEDIYEVTADVRVTIIPTGERPRIHALLVAEDLAEIRVDNRPVIFTVDEEIDFEVRTRVNNALFTDDFVWIINDLDVEEGTLEMRRSADTEGARGLTVHQALERMEDTVPDVAYKGRWYFVFAGGCITYDFDASGTVAETVKQDASEAIGFYDNAALLEAGRRAGFQLVEE
jgi:hypothetical protein